MARAQTLASLLLISMLGGSLAAQSASALQKRVDQYLKPLVTQGLFRGTVLLARDGKVLVERGYGLAHIGDKRPNTKSTRYKLMSISKTLITASVMRLAQDGKLALEDPVGKHLPGWPPAWSAVTLHDLLDHSAGLPELEQLWRDAQGRAGKRGLPVWPEFAKAVQQKPLVAAPGKEFRYRNFNVEIIGLVVESVSGQSYRDFLKKSVLEPLALEHTGFDDGTALPELAVGYGLDRLGQPVETNEDMSRIQAACGLYATAADLYRFDRALRDPAWIAADTHRVMVTPRRGNYACSWVNAAMHGHTCLRHSCGGFGYRGDFVRFPDDDATLIVLANSSFAPIVRISHDLAAIMLRQKPARPVVLDARTRERCAGVFRSSNGDLLLVHPRGDLLVAFHFQGGFRSSVLLPIGKNEFAEAVPGDVRLVFERRRARRVDYVSNGKKTVMQRVEVPLDRWKKAQGPLKAAPALVRKVEFGADGDRLTLQVDDQPPIEVLPVDGDRAFALYGTFEATWLQREGKAFRLQIKGIDFRLLPQQ